MNVEERGGLRKVFTSTYVPPRNTIETLKKLLASNQCLIKMLQGERAVKRTILMNAMEAEKECPDGGLDDGLHSSTEVYTASDADGSHAKGGEATSADHASQGQG